MEKKDCAAETFQLDRRYSWFIMECGVRFEGAGHIMHELDRGTLVPEGGGDVIPLIRDSLTIGRRESCDICLRFPNVSGLHCELSFKDGCWTIRDKGSTNGIKVNGVRVQKKVLHPGDTITIAKRTYKIEYNLTIGKQALSELLEDSDDMIDIPLLEKAGLAKPREDKLDKKLKQRRPWDYDETDADD